MASVFKIGISSNFKETMNSVQSVEAITGKGLVKDRFFRKSNNKISQLTLIEKEKIDEFNKLLNIEIPYINFRRNIITEGVNLNNLLNGNIKIGNVRLRGHKLCEPCRHLQETLKIDNLVKHLIHKAGLRCEILSDGRISVGDKLFY